MSTPAFTAPCQHCGGSMPIALAGPEPPCPFCGKPFEVVPSLQTKLDSLRQTIARRDARKEQLVGRQARLGREHGPLLLLAPLSAWLLAVATVWVMIDSPGLGPAEILGPVTGESATHKAWLLAALTVALGVTLVGFGVAFVRARRVVRHSFPLPPTADGQPPRCRVCSAPLPGDGRVRACEYCGADHLVLGQYQRADAQIDAALDERERQLDQSLESRSRAVWRTLPLGAALSVLVVLAAPVVLFAGPYSPAVLYAGLGLCGLGAGLVLLGSLMPVPVLRTIGEAVTDDVVVFGGTEYRVLGQLHLPAPGRQATSYAMILADDSGAPAMALKTPIPDDGEVTYHPLAPGGEPLDPSEAASLQPLPLDRRIDSGPLAGSQPHGLSTGGKARVWLGSTAPGSEPYFTAAPPKRIARDRLAFRTNL